MRLSQTKLLRVCFVLLCRYESGTLAYVWPLGRVTLSLHSPFLTNEALASAVLSDVSYPETPVIIEDLHLIGNDTVQPFRAAAKKRIRSAHSLLFFCFNFHAE